jgi:hypothetical protein
MRSSSGSGSCRTWSNMLARSDLPKKWSNPLAVRMNLASCSVKRGLVVGTCCWEYWPQFTYECVQVVLLCTITSLSSHMASAACWGVSTAWTACKSQYTPAQ